MPTGRKVESPWSAQEISTLLDLLEKLRVVPKPPFLEPSPQGQSTTLANFVAQFMGAPANPEVTKHDTAPLWQRLKQNPLYLSLKRKNPALKRLQSKFREIMVRRRGMEPGAHAEF